MWLTLAVYVCIIISMCDACVPLSVHGYRNITMFDYYICFHMHLGKFLWKSNSDSRPVGRNRHEFKRCIRKPVCAVWIKKRVDLWKRFTTESLYDLPFPIISIHIKFVYYESENDIVREKCLNLQKFWLIEFHIQLNETRASETRSEFNWSTFKEIQCQ